MSEAGASVEQQPATIGSAEHYGAFIRLMRLRIEQLGISYETCDELCGLGRGNPVRGSGYVW